MAQASNHAGRMLQCEGIGPHNRGCFNLADLGKLTEPQFREQFGAILCLACYVHDWTRPHKPVYRTQYSRAGVRIFSRSEIDARVRVVR